MYTCTCVFVYVHIQYTSATICIYPFSLSHCRSCDATREHPTCTYSLSHVVKYSSVGYTLEASLSICPPGCIESTTSAS